MANKLSSGKTINVTSSFPLWSYALVIIVVLATTIIFRTMIKYCKKNNDIDNEYTPVNQQLSTYDAI